MHFHPGGIVLFLQPDSDITISVNVCTGSRKLVPAIV
jgi:hypothetical protein